MQTHPTVILVHGAFHGSWCWQKVIEYLRPRGLRAIALDLPGHGNRAGPSGGLSECVDCLRASIAACDGPVIVCGHSLGGAIITESIDTAKSVQNLIYIAALVPDVGETAIENTPELLSGDIGNASQLKDDGTVEVDPSAAASIFYHDCDADITEWAVSQLGSQNPAISMTPLTNAAWSQCDSTYVICEEDRALPVAVQERISRRCSNVIRWPTSHSPMLSQPHLLGELLLELAKFSIDHH